MSNHISRQQALNELHAHIEEIKEVWDDIYKQIAGTTELELTTDQIIQQIYLVEQMIRQTRETLNLFSCLSSAFRS